MYTIEIKGYNTDYPLGNNIHITDNGHMCASTPEPLARQLLEMLAVDAVDLDTDDLNQLLKECDPEILLEDWPNDVVVFAYVGDSEICITGKLRHESCYSVNSMAFFNNWKEVTCDFGGDTKHLTFYLEAANV